MNNEEKERAVEQIKLFAQQWNELYAEKKFDEMRNLATEDIGIANTGASDDLSGLIFGRDAYKKGIVDAYYGKSGEEHNLLVMKFNGWEYIQLDCNSFYTIGRYTLQPDIVGVNCWLLRKESFDSPWKIFRVINN